MDIKVSKLIDLAIEEDISTGDITTLTCVEGSILGRGQLIAKEDLCLCGQEVFSEVFRRVDDKIELRFNAGEGQLVKSQTVVAEIEGRVSSMLIAERTALNFMQRLSGIATKTKRIVDLVKDTGVQIIDTRKTTPGWRILEKYAVITGGGANHRYGLYDAVLIKNNHIDVNKGDIAYCYNQAKSKNKPNTFIQIEIRNITELERTLKLEADSVLLDNLTPEQTNEFVNIIRKQKPKMIIESSGGINEKNILAYAKTGIDRISLGALTHSAVAVDLSLRINSNS